MARKGSSCAPPGPWLWPREPRRSLARSVWSGPLRAPAPISATAINGAGRPIRPPTALTPGSISGLPTRSPSWVMDSARLPSAQILRMRRRGYVCGMRTDTAQTALLEGYRCRNSGGHATRRMGGRFPSPMLTKRRSGAGARRLSPCRGRDKSICSGSGHWPRQRSSGACSLTLNDKVPNGNCRGCRI
ncbi:hypothetical protein SMALB_7492 [Streptomyces malaysiensis]|uniref:Uncharacterized protein n=1 Tax=Streptomyces malaysiensis TaxID=92644 RepID=A0A7X5XA20_STRMQ|nr:hypothetical protein [Streptomyces malaysiensis]